MNAFCWDKKEKKNFRIKKDMEGNLVTFGSEQ